MNKRYYWLKLQKDFFKSKAMKKLRKIAGGETYTIIYLKLQLLSLENEGFLYFDNVEESFIEELALEIDEQVDNVKVTLLYIRKVGLIEEINEETIKMIEVIKNTGSETQSTRRSQLSRSKALQCNTNATKCNTEKELEIEEELEREKELNINTAEKSAKLAKKEQLKKELEESFTRFWNNYDKKTDRKRSLQLWSNIKKEDREIAIAKALEYAKATPDPKFRKHPTTWLNGECWNDAIITAKPNYKPQDEFKYGRGETF